MLCSLCLVLGLDPAGRCASTESAKHEVQRTKFRIEYNKIGDAEPESPRHPFNGYSLFSAERLKSLLGSRSGRGLLGCLLFLAALVSEGGGSLTRHFGLFLILGFLIGLAFHIGYLGSLEQKVGFVRPG